MGFWFVCCCCCFFGGGSRLSGGYFGARKSMRRSLDFRAPKEFENKPTGEPASRLREGEGVGGGQGACVLRFGRERVLKRVLPYSSVQASISA